MCRMQNAFDVGTRGKTARRYLLAAESSDTRQQWMMILAKVDSVHQCFIVYTAAYNKGCYMLL